MDNNIPLSGMRVQQKRLAASAHNTANTSTDGFERQRVTARENPSGGAQAEVDTVELSDQGQKIAQSIDGPQNNVNQVNETVDRIESGAGFTANARALRAMDRLVKSFLDLFA